MGFRLSAVIISVIFASEPGAQTYKPGALIEGSSPLVQRGTIAPSVSRSAPWLAPDNSKQQFYVFRSFAPPAVTAQIDRPVADPAYRAQLARRAAALRIGPRVLRLAVNPNAIVDAGAARAGEANTAASIELENSPDLLAMVRGELRVDPNQNYVVPFLLSRYARVSGPRPAYRVNDRVQVTVVPKNLAGIAVWTFTDGRWQREYQSARRVMSEQERRSTLDLLNARAMGRQYSGYSGVALAQSVDSVQAQDLMRLIMVLGNPSAPSSPAPAPAPAVSPPQTYTAFGSSPLCRQQCSKESCLACCGQAFLVEQATVFSLALTCHMLSDLCPWCHIGCAANTAAMSLAMAAHDTICVGGCAFGKETLASQGNPKNCPLH